ncbi:transcriptional repressor LexA [Methylophaga sp. OBS3]|uniref:transcriptional repressor LexA n=1 Tax=Methylophaga sp. OBS3 TaxID=2991934 RepID=UPI0022523AFE|nr:transcriptional repressor LexA [Methylophaga sp. OBS3]MCX4189171.1 transcriptional repressor LexA [Methylophaga sp. OBS3]
MITQRGRDTLKFIENYMRENGYAPTMEEIAEGLGIKSVGSAHHYVDQLLKAGELERMDKRSRGLRLKNITDDEERTILPVMGKIAAGRLIEAVPDESEIDVGAMFAGSGRYVLKISGESMIGKGIMPGDYVVIDGKKQAKDGDVIVALVDGYDATLKTMLLNNDGTMTLMPANPDFEPVTLAGERVSIQGVVVGQMRTYP